MLIGQGIHSFQTQNKDVFITHNLSLSDSFQFPAISKSLKCVRQQTVKKENTQLVNQKENTQQPIGQATMQEDGSIILQLWAETDDGASGQTFLTYSPTDEDYASILEHIGCLEVGKTKLVFPWPDE